MSGHGEALFWLGLLFVAYVYVGYPTLLAMAASLIGRKGPQGSRERSDLPHVTLLITAYNEERVLGAKLENALSLTYPPERLQILVAADGSTDRTVAIVREYEGRGVELSFGADRRGKTAALTRAVGRARGEIVIFSDANNAYSSDALLHLVAPFDEPGVGAVGGAKAIAHGDGALGDTEGAYWRYEDRIKRWESSLGSTVAVCGEILALRKAPLRTPPADVINDDFWFATDMLGRGYSVLYAPAARSVERVSATLEDELGRRSRIVAGRFQAFRQIGLGLALRRPRVMWSMVSHKLMRPLVPFAMIAMAIGNLVWLLGGTPASFAMAGAQVLVYLTAFMVGDRSDTARFGRIGAVLYAVSFLVRSNLAALDGLAGLVRGRQTSLWRRVARRGE